MNESEHVYEKIRKVVYQVLGDNNLLQGHWHLGKVESVIDRYKLKVFIDSSTSPQTVPCNPNVIFRPNDEVWVHYVNGNSMNKFVPYKRATGTESL